MRLDDDALLKLHTLDHDTLRDLREGLVDGSVAEMGYPLGEPELAAATVEVIDRVLTGEPVIYVGPLFEDLLDRVARTQARPLLAGVSTVEDLFDQLADPVAALKAATADVAVAERRTPAPDAALAPAPARDLVAVPVARMAAWRAGKLKPPTSSPGAPTMAPRSPGATAANTSPAGAAPGETPEAVDGEMSARRTGARSPVEVRSSRWQRTGRRRLMGWWRR